MDQITKRDHAIRAESLLGDEILTGALADMEAAAVESLSTADVTDHAALQRATADLQAVRRFKSRLRSMVQDQKYADRAPIATA